MCAFNDIKKKRFVRYIPEIHSTTPTTPNTIQSMVRTSKPLSAPAPSSAAPTSAATAVPSANVVEKKEKAPKKAATASTTPSAKASTEVKAASAAVPVVEATETTEEGAEEGVATEVSATEKLAAFAALLAAGNNVFVQIKNQFKILEKNIQKELKFAQKVSNRKLKRSGNRKPSGFVCPTLVSDELCAFLGYPAGTMLARTEVSSKINEYVKTNGLKNATNGRQINADAKLSQLLKIPDGDILTFFNLQRYLKSHFIKAEVAASVPAAVPASVPVGASV